MFAFYIPEAEAHPRPLPQHIDAYEQWRLAASRTHAWLGRFNWTLQTALQLQAAGAPVELVTELPAEGIVIAHRDFLPTRHVLGPRQSWVCLLADRTQPGDAGRHPIAQLHVLQNPRDPLLLRPDRLWPAVAVPHWPQAGLQPREESRGLRLETIGYFGIETNLAAALRTAEFSAWCAARGLSFVIVPRERWADYRALDLALAVRDFDPRSDLHPAKPASKLVNAWLAGTPAILGRESAYQALRRDPLDYLEVGTLEEAQAAIVRLQSDPAEVARMRAHGQARAREYDARAVVAAWEAVLSTVIVPAHEAWCRRSRASQLAFLSRRAASHVERRVRRRLARAGVAAAPGVPGAKRTP